MQITRESPNQPDVIALIDALDAYQSSLYPAESNHLLDINSLTQPNVLFVVMRDAPGGPAIGCGAVVLMGDYGEVKRMYVQPSGFTRCGRYGDYPDDPLSIFMEKRIAA